VNINIQQIRDVVASNAQRVALLGDWAIDVDLDKSINSRIPEKDKTAAGFDAGIACCYNLIPMPRQRLAATLHANYTPEAIAQVIRESQNHEVDPDSETGWWLSASSVCKEGGQTVDTFIDQILTFKGLVRNSVARTVAAESMLQKMRSTFNMDKGFPFGTVDGCAQGAYLAGHKWATWYDKDDDLYFIGTFHEGMEKALKDFEWSDELAEDGRTKSGKIYDKLFKCANEDEFLRAAEVVKAHFA